MIKRAEEREEFRNLMRSWICREQLHVCRISGIGMNRVMQWARFKTSARRLVKNFFLLKTFSNFFQTFFSEFLQIDFSDILLEILLEILLDLLFEILFDRLREDTREENSGDEHTGTGRTLARSNGHQLLRGKSGKFSCCTHHYRTQGTKCNWNASELKCSHTNPLARSATTAMAAHTASGLNSI